MQSKFNKDILFIYLSDFIYKYKYFLILSSTFNKMNIFNSTQPKFTN